MWGSEFSLQETRSTLQSSALPAGGRSGQAPVLTKFSLVSRVISCCRLASMRASGGSCRFCASSCCCRLFSSFRLWISPRRASASFSWLLFWDWSWDSRSLWRSHTDRKGRWHKSPCPVGARLRAHFKGRKSEDTSSCVTSDLTKVRSSNKTRKGCECSHVCLSELWTLPQVSSSQSPWEAGEF